MSQKASSFILSFIGMRSGELRIEIDLCLMYGVNSIS